MAKLQIIKFLLVLMCICCFANEKNKNPYAIQQEELPKDHAWVKITKKEKKLGAVNLDYVSEKFVVDFCKRIKMNKKNIKKIYSATAKGKSDLSGYIVFYLKDKETVKLYLKKIVKTMIGWVLVYQNEGNLVLFWSHDQNSVPTLKEWANLVCKRLEQKNKIKLTFLGKTYVVPIF